MNSELKLVVFEEKGILQELLEILDHQYLAVLNKELLKLENITFLLEKISKRLATIEIKRRNLIKHDDFKSVIESSDDEHIKNVYEEIRVLLKNIQLQKDTNDTLIKQNLFFVNKMINVIKPPKNVATYNSYGKVGR